jgi:hypothetical protein
MPLRPMVQKDSRSNHYRQGKEKSRTVELPDSRIFQAVDPVQVFPTAAGKNNFGLNNSQYQSCQYCHPGPEPTWFEVNSAPDQLHPTSE